jgi:hypothetical protein
MCKSCLVLLFLYLIWRSNLVDKDHQHTLNFPHVAQNVAAAACYPRDILVKIHVSKHLLGIVMTRLSFQIRLYKSPLITHSND